jgi:NAD(P)-dependent dehydrogenase (short-subunit alcohol dehydrogenase family)
VVVLNAAMIAASGRNSPQGFDQMVAVNYVGNFVLVNRLLADGVIPNATRAANPVTPPPRIVVVSSEAHRWPRDTGLSCLESAQPYGMNESLMRYAFSKFYLTAFASELARRLSRTQGPDVAVHTLCPGAVNSRIAREAPAWIQPLVRAFLGVFFRPPSRAAEPVLYLSCSRSLDSATGVYLHVMARGEVDPRAADPAFGARLWTRTEELLAERAAIRPAGG